MTYSNFFYSFFKIKINICSLNFYLYGINLIFKVNINIKIIKKIITQY